jgi:hypothetical protein
MPLGSSKSVSYLQVLLGSWFALGLLLVLALGIGLIGVLHYWGPWLEENWNLTFPSPLSPGLWWLFAAVPFGVLLLYFLKLKRRALHVPSTFLWRKSIEDLHVNSLFQWLRRNILLILQLLFLLGVGYALADPTYNSEARGRHLILMIDNSASMAATDVSPPFEGGAGGGGSRLAKAKQLAHERIDALDPSDQAMVIAFSNEAQTIQSYTNRKEDLHRAVDRIEQTHRPTAFEPALALAEGQANPRRSGEEAGVEQPAGGENMPRAMGSVEGVPTDVHIYSDGRFADVADFSLGRLRPQLHRIGSSANNVGISRVGLRRDEDKPDTFEVEVHVKNFSDTAIAGRLDVLLELFASGARQDRKLWPGGISLKKRVVQEVASGPDGRKKTTIVPGDAVPQPILTFSIRDPGPGYVRVNLLDRASGQPWSDAFAIDDVAWLAITPVRKARILRIGPANDILDAFLRASEKQQRAEVTSIPALGFASQPPYREAVDGEAFDLVIFDRVAPGSMAEMPQANTFFIGQVPPLKTPGANAPGSPDLWSSMKVLKNVYALEYMTTHPFLRGIETLQGMAVMEARALPKDALPARASALLETQLEPIMWALGRERYTDLVLTFPLVVEDARAKGPVWNTNWPKQPAGTFPLFMDNVLTRLGRFKEYEEAHKPGMPKTLEPGAAVATVAVTRADPPGPPSETCKRESGKELVYGPPNLVGLYEAAWNGTVGYRFAVNLFDPQESQIEPRDELQIGEEQIERSEEPVKRRQELWLWFVLAALGILLLEWFIYNRRISV